MKLYQHTPLAGTTPLAQVSEYHQRSKHTLEQYAAGPQTLDWGDQPEAFRWFEASDQVELPFCGDAAGVKYAQLFRAGAVSPASLNRESVAQLFELSLGLAGWKSNGVDSWALRCNPSSGNLHPTEGYLICPELPGLASGVYHYLSRDHLLERRCLPDGEGATSLAEQLGPNTLLVGLSAIHWREAWKYGERAFRYCQLDAGHAFGAIAVAAATLGWRAEWLAGAGDGEIAALLGLNRESDFAQGEHEAPDLLMRLSPGDVSQGPEPDLTPLIALLEASPWQGGANDLRAEHYHDWPVIEEVARACEKPAATPPALPVASLPVLSELTHDPMAADLIRQRRSAQAFDGASSLSAASFYRLLDTLLVRDDTLPWSGFAAEAQIHLLLFVHRVGGLRPGIYLLSRSEAGEALLRKELRADFAWQPVAGAPAHLPLKFLLEGDARQVAATLSCHQSIAANGAFAVAMLGELQSALTSGPWGYRRLYWEAGLLGQLLYLEAEAAGLSGTGIGCFFDDVVHELVGLEGERFQSLYHFTVGGAVRDTRLQSLSPWHHLASGRGADTRHP